MAFFPPQGAILKISRATPYLFFIPAKARFAENKKTSPKSFPVEKFLEEVFYLFFSRIFPIADFAFLPGGKTEPGGKSPNNWRRPTGYCRGPPAL